jgi:hypothetical protein
MIGPFQMYTRDSMINELPYRHTRSICSALPGICPINAIAQPRRGEHICFWSGWFRLELMTTFRVREVGV